MGRSGSADTAPPWVGYDWHQTIRRELGAGLDALAVDFLAIGQCELEPKAVQLSQVLFFDGEVHEDRGALESHCASLIAVWNAVRTPSVIDLGQCVCIGRRILPLRQRHGRRFAVHAIANRDSESVFAVISSQEPWAVVDEARAVVETLTRHVQKCKTNVHLRARTHNSTADVALDWYMFTARELEILRLLAQGLSNKLIARELGTSPNTIRNQIHAVFRKAAVSNRTELALRAARLGLNGLGA